MEFVSPLVSEPVVNRDTGAKLKSRGAPPPDEDTIDVEIEEVESQTPPPKSRGGAGKPPPTEEDFDTGFDDSESVEEPNYEENFNDIDLDHASDDEAAQYAEMLQKLSVKTILDLVEKAAPEGAGYLTKIDTEEVEKLQKNLPAHLKLIDVSELKKKNVANLETFKKYTRVYTSLVERPLRQLAKEQEVQMSPQALVIVLTLAYVVVMSVVGYSIRVDNQATLKDINTKYTTIIAELEAMKKAQQEFVRKQEKQEDNKES